MALDTKLLLQAAGIVTAISVLGGAGVYGLKAAVTYVGGSHTPYASEDEEIQTVADVKKVKQSIPYIIWQLLQNDADNCDNRTTVLNLQARSTKNADLQKEADKNDRSCGKLHDEADHAAKALLPG